MESIEHPALGRVSIRHSARARRIAISVRSSGEVILTIPKGASRDLALRFLDSSVERIVKSRGRMTSGERLQPRPLSPSERGYLVDRTAQLAKEHGFRYDRLTLRAMRTKWGSCVHYVGGGDNISLNTMLMQLPPHLIDFVILHELTHTIHHNHSKEFHNALNRVLNGDERELNSELKRYRLG